MDKHSNMNGTENALEVEIQELRKHTSTVMEEQRRRLIIMDKKLKEIDEWRKEMEKQKKIREAQMMEELEERWRKVDESRVEVLKQQNVEILELKTKLAETEQRCDAMEEEMQTFMQEDVEEKLTRVTKDNSWETRLAALEAALGKAVNYMFPRMDELLSKIQERYPLSTLPSSFCTTDGPDSAMNIPRTEESPTPSSESSTSVKSKNRAKGSSKSPPVRSKPLPTDLNSALRDAAKVGDVDEVCRLLLAGADSNSSDNLRTTALHWAAIKGHVEAAAALLDGGDADVDPLDASGWTPLHFAASRGHAAVVSFLLRYGADVERKDDKHWTPMHAAVHGGHVECVRQLLRAGGDVIARDGGAGKKLMDLADAEPVRQLLIDAIFESSEEEI